jgi:hypothetical protein
MPAHRSFLQRIIVAAMWLFLMPLIIILGLVDTVTGGASRGWPLDLRRNH